MSTTKLVKMFEYGKAGIIQFNRPAALNAINKEMWKNMHELISMMEHQKDIVILKGSGKIFCAGGDIKQLTRASPDEAYVVYSLACRTFDRISNYKKPFVALVDGLTMGGAAIYAMSGKYRIATERTKFSMPETIIGYFNDAASSYWLSRLENNFGIYVGLTGSYVKGYDMKKSGLATHYVESEKLDQLEQSLIRCQSHADVEKVLSESSSDPPSCASELDKILPNINKCFGGVTVEEIFDNLDNDGSEWAKDTLTVLKMKSPTSLKVSHRSFTTGKNISLRECLNMEMVLTINYCTDGTDAKEGVRAMLIDKDLKPNWSRKSIYEVANEDVERFFRPIPKKYELIFDEQLTNKL
ncbi:hypothetical protein HA402_001642 [Bradysia odoriphaga]|nr:hypothetical protein HA402_001642 [Bradysia odoriphaga]